MFDAVRGYIQLAAGLTEAAAAKVRDATSAVLSGDSDDGKDAGAAAAAAAAKNSIQDLADDLVGQATASREVLTSLIRVEVDRAAGRLGLVREEELAALRRQVERLQKDVAGTATESPKRRAAPGAQRRRAPGSPSAAGAAPSPSATPTPATEKVTTANTGVESRSTDPVP